MTFLEEAKALYRSINVKPAITASGSTTAYGGTKLRPEVMDAMNKAASVMVDMKELNLAAGRIIADLTGAEAGLGTGGAASGMTLQAAACIAGSDPGKMNQLPDTQNLKMKFLCTKASAFSMTSVIVLPGQNWSILEREGVVPPGNLNPHSATKQLP